MSHGIGEGKTEATDKKASDAVPVMQSKSFYPTSAEFKTVATQMFLDGLTKEQLELIATKIGMIKFKEECSSIFELSVPAKTVSTLSSVAVNSMSSAPTELLPSTGSGNFLPSSSSSIVVSATSSSSSSSGGGKGKESKEIKKEEEKLEMVGEGILPDLEPVDDSSYVPEEQLRILSDRER